MVSKTIKIIASKISPITNHHGVKRPHRRTSLVKKPDSAVLAAQIQISPDPAWPHQMTATTSHPLLPPLTSPEKRTVVLDLDETLVHSSATVPRRFDFVVRPVICGVEMTFYVTKRPGVDEFLQKLAESGCYEVVVFTAGMKEYAALLIDRLDRQRKLISHRLYRGSCTEVNGRYVKDMSCLGRDLRRVVIVDDNPNSYSFQPENGVPVRSFVYDTVDRELARLLEFFQGEGIRCCEDIRDSVREYVKNGGRISDDEDDDDDEDEDDDSDGSDSDDDEEEDEDLKENSKKSSNNVGVVRSMGNSNNVLEYYLSKSESTSRPVSVECRVKMVMLGTFILTLINLILMLRMSL